LEKRYSLCVQNTEEIISKKDLREVLERKPHPRTYIGYEVSGLLHIGSGLITGRKVLDLVNAGCHVIIFLADWHSWINNKLEGDMKKIRIAGEYYKDCFKAMGLTKDKVEFKWASELAEDGSYWERVIRVAKSASLRRIMRTLPIMGREAKNQELESAWIYYPAMQCADIFYMELDLVLGGLDQRKAHMLTRDIAEKLGWSKPVAIHTPLLSGLRGDKKMDLEATPDLTAKIEVKMSKSKPSTCIFLHDPPDTINKKINGAFCPPNVVEGNPVIDICRLVIFPDQDTFTLDRPSKYGGPIKLGSLQELSKLYLKGKIHPADLKKGVANTLGDLLEPFRQYFKKKPKNLKKVEEMIVTR
jgi:tyrosyl-tRNA synthetase